MGIGIVLFIRMVMWFTASFSAPGSIVAAKKAMEAPAPPKGLTMHYGTVAEP
jgi:hypothetical protein